MADLISKALKQCDDAELFIEKSEDYPVVFEGNRLKSVKSGLLRGYGLRTMKNGRIGFAAATDIDENRGERLIDSSIAASKFGPEANFSFWKGKRSPAAEIFEPAIVSFEVEEAERLGQKLINRLRDMLPDVYIDLVLGRTFSEVSHLTRDCERNYYKTSAYISISAITVEPKSILNIYESAYGAQSIQNPYQLIAELMWKSKMSQNVCDIRSGKMPVIFTPKAASVVLDPLLVGLSGRHVASQSSPLTGRLGENILSSEFSMYDDALIPFAAASSPFDDEGVPRQRFPLFDKGVLKNYFLDLKTAAILNMDSTASASRRYLSQPLPAPSNVQVQTGDLSFDEIVEGIEEGLIVDQVMGAGQSNLLNGEFLVQIQLGFVIKHGKIVGRVKDCMVAGNSYDLLANNLRALGNEAVFAGKYLTPHICLNDVSVAGKG